MLKGGHWWTEVKWWWQTEAEGWLRNHNPRSQASMCLEEARSFAVLWAKVNLVGGNLNLHGVRRAALSAEIMPPLTSSCWLLPTPHTQPFSVPSGYSDGVVRYSRGHC